jgi:hypothetical protein
MTLPRIQIKLPIAVILAVLVPFLIAGCRTEKAATQSSASTAAKTVAPKASATQDEAVTQCISAYTALVGAEGCIPGLMSGERILAACQSYASWAAGGDTCGSDAFRDFYVCLQAISCDVFIEDEDGKTEFPKEYEECRAEFAKDMNDCILAAAS